MRQKCYFHPNGTSYPVTWPPEIPRGSCQVLTSAGILLYSSKLSLFAGICKHNMYPIFWLSLLSTSCSMVYIFACLWHEFRVASYYLLARYIYLQVCFTGTGACPFSRCHDMETLSKLMVLCEEIHRSPVDYPHKWQVTQNFDCLMFAWTLWRSCDALECEAP